MRRYFLIGLVLMFALIGTVSAQAELDVNGDVPPVLIIQWENPRALNWVFNAANQSHAGCDLLFDEGAYADGVCMFNDGNEDLSSADLYMESNLDGEWDVDFNSSEGDSYLYRILGGGFTPAHTLNMTRHTSHGGDVAEPFATKFWTFHNGDPNCDIDVDMGGSCDVGIELYQGITDDEVHPGAGRLKQGAYAVTIIAEMFP